MARYKHVTTGVVVEAADDLVLGSEWGPADGGSDTRGETPNKSWKVDDLKAYAADNGIDLGDATKKEDIVAAIAAAADSGTGE